MLPQRQLWKQGGKSELSIRETALISYAYSAIVERATINAALFAVIVSVLSKE